MHRTIFSTATILNRSWALLPLAASRRIRPSLLHLHRRPTTTAAAVPIVIMASSYNTISAEDHQPGLRTFVDGKEDGPVIVFVHGWPDDHALWDNQVCSMYVCVWWCSIKTILRVFIAQQCVVGQFKTLIKISQEGCPCC